MTSAPTRFKLQRDMSESALAGAGIGWLSRAFVDEIDCRFEESGKRLMAIDGFMGSGKTPFGSMIEARLGRRCIRIDGYLPLTPPENQTRYIDRLDTGRLASDLTWSLNEGSAAIEGILAREVLKLLGRSDEAFHVYVAGAWVTGPGKVKWPDAAQLGSIQSSALHREIVEYHTAEAPQERFDAAILRNQNEPEETGTFIAPDGQLFSISEVAWPRGQIDQLRISRFAFTSDRRGAILEPVGLIRPPILSAATRLLNDQRLHSILSAIRSNVPLPPVAIIRESPLSMGVLLDGAHRYFGSIAAGATLIPAEHVSPEDAEIRFRYVANR
jgi:hypothetical protein